MQFIRRSTKRTYSQLDRPCGLTAIDVLNSKRYLKWAITFISFYERIGLINEEDEHLKFPCLMIGLYFALLYTYINTEVNFLTQRLPNVHNYKQYNIASQPEASFQLKFGRLSKAQALRVHNALQLPVLLSTNNRVRFSSELGYLIFLRY
jgi:hypothetical protein